MRMKLRLSLDSAIIVHAAVEPITPLLLLFTVAITHELTNFLDGNVQSSDVLLLGLHRLLVDLVDAFQHFNFLLFKFLQVLLFLLTFLSCLLCRIFVGTVQLGESFTPIIPVAFLGLLAEVMYALMFSLLLLVNLASNLLDLAFMRS